MRFSSLAEWLDWQTGLSPKAIDLGLDRVRKVWSALGAPSLNATVISVAGTNGKGSSVAFAEAILVAGGYRTGVYTSPHLIHYNERVRIDQTAVDDAGLCRAFAAIDEARGDTPLTYFEFGTLAALWLFAEAGLDAVILEVGLGGRLDAVNMIDADVAVITSISLDHQDWLGNDLDAIGREKAGIMRQGRPCVFSSNAMPASIRNEADRIGAKLIVAGEDYRVVRRGESWDIEAPDLGRRALPIPGMRGRIQIDNAAGVLVALNCVADRLPLDQRAARAGVLAARIPGRFEVRPGRPTWVLDVAHNPEAAGVLSDMLGDHFMQGKVISVCGMLADKDAAGVARVLAKRFDAWYLLDLSSQPRGLSAQALATLMQPELGDTPVTAMADIDATLSAIVADSGEHDMVVVFGSFLTVGAAMAWLDTRADGEVGA